MNIRYRVTLTQCERDELGALLSGGKHPVRRLKRAQILLAADAGVGDEDIASSIGVGGSTVYRTKRRFVEGNMASRTRGRAALPVPRRDRSAGSQWCIATDARQQPSVVLENRRPRVSCAGTVGVMGRIDRLPQADRPLRDFHDPEPVHLLDDGQSLPAFDIMQDHEPAHVAAEFVVHHVDRLKLVQCAADRIV